VSDLSYQDRMTALERAAEAAIGTIHPTDLLEAFQRGAVEALRPRGIDTTMYLDRYQAGVAQGVERFLRANSEDVIEAIARKAGR
jgi:hypothetical protein